MSTATLPAGQPKSPPTSGRLSNGLYPEDSLYEIIHGQRVELPPMSVRSIWLGTRLTKALSNHVDDHQLGTVVSECMFIFDVDEKEQRRPDLAFVSAATWPLDREIPLTGDWKVVPDLAVEVISPNDLFEKVLAKLQEYFDFGVKQVWVISPTEEKIYIYDSPVKVRILSAADDLEGGELLPGFRLKIVELFHRTVPT